MAISGTNIQALSDMLHYYLQNCAGRNDTAEGIIEKAIRIVDVELIIQGGTVKLDPKVVG